MKLTSNLVDIYIYHGCLKKTKLDTRMTFEVSQDRIKPFDANYAHFYPNHIDVYNRLKLEASGKSLASFTPYTDRVIKQINSNPGRIVRHYIGRIELDQSIKDLNFKISHEDSTVEVSDYLVEAISIVNVEDQQPK